MVKLIFQCPKCPQRIAFRVKSEHLGKSYLLTHPSCDGSLEVVIPLNALLLSAVAPERGMFDDTLDNFDVLIDRLKKGKKY